MKTPYGSVLPSSLFSDSDMRGFSAFNSRYQNFGLKIGVFNPNSVDTTAKVRPIITCPTPGTGGTNVLEIGSDQVNSQIIEKRSSKVFVYVAKLDGAAKEGKQLMPVLIWSCCRLIIRPLCGI